MLWEARGFGGRLEKPHDQGRAEMRRDRALHEWGPVEEGLSRRFMLIIHLVLSWRWSSWGGSKDSICGGCSHTYSTLNVVLGTAGIDRNRMTIP